MNKLNQRQNSYSKVSAKLASLDEVALLALLEKATPMHKGIGGKSALINIEGSQVFIKQVPLTDIELLPSNVNSTANLFELPLCYQYGVGSAGFNAWRELNAHIMTTQWVLNAQCPNFPLLYHWQVLPNDPNDINIEYWGDIEKYCAYWEQSKAVRHRIEALNQASFHITLFLEFVPQNLYQWLGAQISGENADSAIKMVEMSLKETNQFMRSQEFVHFDAHFENILCDGECLYVSDFGLALSSAFDLSPSERAFLKTHQHYDQSCAAVNLIHCIITSIFGKEQWVDKLQDCLEKENKQLSPFINTIIKKYGPVALMMDTFFVQLQNESKQTPYPEKLLDDLLLQSFK
ncbi:MAG: hypothetical protein AB7V32_10675 [Candidatus Berkiella sp.]